MPIRVVITVALLAMLPGAGLAQKLPADCSAAAAPKEPPAVSVDGVKFTPKSVTLSPAGGMASGGEQFDSYRLSRWAFKNRPEKTGSSHAEYLASLRLEPGKRQGDTISGNIYLCVAKGQTSIFNRTPTKEDSYTVGTFQARIGK